MKLNQETIYAIRMALLCTEYNPNKLAGSFIISECKVPERWGRTILTKLSAHNILSSTKGKNGGFKLSKDPEFITINDIVSIFEKVDVHLCIVDRNSCSYRTGKCVFCDKLLNLKQFIEKEFSQLTLKELVCQQNETYNNT